MATHCGNISAGLSCPHSDYTHTQVSEVFGNVMGTLGRVVVVEGSEGKWAGRQTLYFHLVLPIGLLQGNMVCRPNCLDLRRLPETS